MTMHEHDPDSRRAAYDARGIFLTYVCDQCEAEKLKGFRADVLTDADYWTDEPVDEDSTSTLDDSDLDTL